MPYDIKSDIKWFEDNLDHLYSLYPEKFLVVKDKKVLGAYDSTISAVSGTPLPLGQYLLRQCFSDIDAYTINISTPFVVMS